MTEKYKNNINWDKGRYMGLIVRVIVMVIAMGSVVFVMWKLNTTGIDPAVFHIEPGHEATFDTGQVTRFEWKTTNKIFSYDRDPSGRWLPEKNEGSLKNLLKFISQIQLNEVEQKGKSALDLSLDINGVRWTGSWDGLSFVWNEGPNKGKGEILSEQKNMVFFKGAHVFESVEIDLCKNRITKILLQHNGKNYQIEQVGRGWDVTKPEPKTLDPIFIEKWLIGLCKVKVRTHLDLSYAESNTKQGAVTFEFVDGHKVSLHHIDKNFFTTKTESHEIGLVLEQLDDLLGELKKQLH